ncbi:MAG: OB-fold nucleic acid binding domain-containing protein [Candidatus Aenigmarchaeota archaeon]|nr:OB-fold nucleic acid binding domain-containing protein [Candidatus Aenigmarchaeota archaeon]MCX8190686.1 OB-fold nucleic acid binding domain-containing protein [Candidatus Aenigmarchaeota archaeon]MDW8159935.1 OB-fold nucleic acid binding domain-containing protein [Candidatus Aenigmarchaeota archaeon]
MKINQIRAGMNKIELEANVVEKSEERTVLTRYGEKRVAEIVLEDETGRIKASLWEEQIDEINVGDRVKIDGAYSTEFKNQLQINIPKKGKIEKL